MNRLAVIALLLVSCSDPSGIERVRKLCDTFAEHLCEGGKGCSCPAASDVSACEKTRSDLCYDGLSGRVSADLDAGRATVDEAALKECTDGLDALAASCRAPNSEKVPAACNRLIIDAAKLDAPCTVTGGGQAFCAGGAGTCVDVGDAHVCRKLPGAGEACASGQCASGLVCDQNVCRTPGKTGDACTSSTSCGAGLTCLPGGKCGAALASGADCERNNQCADGLACQGGKCGSALSIGDECSSAIACGAGRVCARAPETRRCGDPAKAGEVCEEGECGDGLICDTDDHTCKAGPGEGEPCRDNHCGPGLTCVDADHICRKLPKKDETCLVGDSFCAPGFGCDEKTNTCQPGGGDGAPCLLNPPEYVCAEGFGCDFTANGSICRPLAGAGAACETSRTCGAGFSCVDGKCKAKVGEGEDCPGGDECAAGLYCSIADKKCERIPKRDEPCEFTCAEGLVCRGKGGRCVASFCALR